MDFSRPVTEATSLLEINPEIDRSRLAAEFAEHKRVQIRNVLTEDSAHKITQLLVKQTPWGLSWRAGDDGPHKLRKEQAASLPKTDGDQIGHKLTASMGQNDFAFIYSQYQMYDAFVQGWSGGSPHDGLFQDMNSPLFLDLVREVTSLPEIQWADAQATLYAPGQFLSLHQDVEADQGWLVAYVLNFCTRDWRPDWGGYLNFYDEDGDIVAGYRPRFNSLNMFLVPQDHNVSYVPQFAPYGRFAITGWFRDR
ncbi:MAG: 2OG-Fe(II) oxygenase family protein [Halioglobus sp.]